MEQYYSNDSLTAYHTEDGILIEEKKKGSLKMLLIILGLGLLMLLGGVILGILGGSIVRILAPWLIWGAAIVIVVAVIAFVIKLAMNQDPKIIFNTNKNELSLRGKIIPFSTIESITQQEQPMMGKTMMFAFMMINGKKKSLFSTAIVAPNPKEMADFISNLNDIVQKGKNKTDAED